MTLTLDGLVYILEMSVRQPIMEIRFSCSACGQLLVAEEVAAGKKADCPACGVEFAIPRQNGATADAAKTGRAQSKPSPASNSSVPANSKAPAENASGHALAPPNTEGELTCPVCWLRFDIGDIMHIAVHDSLRGDPLLGEDAQQRFLATRFNNAGQALDAMGLPCSELACPHCRRKLPPNFVEMPHRIISLVGDHRAGKSYYLSVLTKVLPATLYRDLGIVFQDSDPTGNAALNDMRKALFGAKTPEQVKVDKTQMYGNMYERLPRQGRTVLLPRPFVYSLTACEGDGGQCAIIFYDNAGEHFQPGQNSADSPGAQHVASAAGIMFLFDPFNSPEFRRCMHTANDPQLETAVVDQQDIILAEMRARIHSIRNLRPEESIQTPVAFIVGKCDAWLHLLDGMALGNPVREGKLDIGVIEENSRRIRKLLFDVCPGVVANAEALSAKLMFFAISSFGHTPLKIGEGEYKYVPDPSKLRPIFVEIPPLWILSQICPSLVKPGASAGK